jgi:hypothetical protein
MLNSAFGNHSEAIACHVQRQKNRGKRGYLWNLQNSTGYSLIPVTNGTPLQRDT